MDRFDRQRRFAGLGDAGQQRLESSAVLLVGCGALGGSLAQTLVRSGVGLVRLIDRDLVELSNLPRQVLFEDADLGRPKADVAAAALKRIGGPSRIEAHCEHVDADNLPGLARDVDVILDGTDNLATRYLLNDYSVAHSVPWIYGGVVGSGGLVMPVLPGHGACLRCVFPEPPPPGALETCESAGVLLPAVAAVAALQAGAALRLLGAAPDGRAAFRPGLLEVDVWTGDVRRIGAERSPSCPCCGAGEFPFLRAPAQGSAVSLCGRNTVQVRPSFPSGIAAGRRADLARIRAGLTGTARDVRDLGSILRFDVETYRITVFADGRALVEGTDDVDRARAVYDRYVGSMNGPALVILAAGASERLGTCKALVDLGGRTPLARLLAAGALLDAAPALVISGPDHAHIAAAAPAGVEVAQNADWSRGRTGSVQLAQRLRPGLALCLAPVDVPRVPGAVFARLRAAWLAAGEPPLGWLAPRAGVPHARHGHPVVLGPALLQQAAGLDPDTPLRRLRESARPLLAVPVVGNEVLEDLDSPADLARLRAILELREA